MFPEDSLQGENRESSLVFAPVAWTLLFSFNGPLLQSGWSNTFSCIMLPQPEHAVTTTSFEGWRDNFPGLLKTACSTGRIVLALGWLVGLTVALTNKTSTLQV